MNTKMADLLAQNHISLDDASLENRIPKKLTELLNAGIIKQNNAFVLERMKQSVSTELSTFGDLTGYECAVNHIHIESYIRQGKSPVEFLETGIGYALALVNRLSSLSWDQPFRVILGFDIEDQMSCVVRFHVVRENETWIKLDDLDGYLLEAILVFDI